MNVRLEAINLLRKLHRGLSFNYTDKELKEISEFLAGKITKEEKLNDRVKKLFEVIKSQQEEISSLKRVIKDSTPQPKQKEVLTYNYLEMSVINEGLEMLVGEIKNTLKHDSSYCSSTLISKRERAEKIINRNKDMLKKIESEDK